MKYIIISLLLLGSAPIFAQDSLSYEELPECYIDFNRWAENNINLADSLQDRAVWVDTCKAKAITNRTNWFDEIDGTDALDFASANKADLIAENGIFSNQFTKLVYYENNVAQSIFRDTNERIESYRLDLADLKQQFQNLKTDYFDLVKENYGEFIIYGNYDKVNDSVFRVTRFNLIFDRFVSMKELDKFSGEHSVHNFDRIILAPLAVEETAEVAKISYQENGIHISELTGNNNISIYNLLGNKLYQVNNIYSPEIFIPLNPAASKLLFVRINNTVYKIIK